MAYRTKLNQHDWWIKVCRENETLLAFLPPFARRREEDYRTLMIEGELSSRDGLETVRLRDLTDQQVKDLWAFNQNKAQFDMDNILFDAFNQEFRSRPQTP